MQHNIKQRTTRSPHQRHLSIVKMERWIIDTLCVCVCVVMIVIKDFHTSGPNWHTDDEVQ